MSEPVSDVTLDRFRTALDRAARRAGVVASNLANVDTPGYRAQDVSFAAVLEDASGVEAARTDPRHLGAASGEASGGIVSDAPVTRMRTDGNTVDVDREMTLLANLGNRYQAMAEMVRKRFGLIVYAVTDGRSGG